MKTLQFLLCATLICAGASATFASTIPAPYELATWRGFSASAVSYTFDDNSPKQFSVAQPMFDEKGLLATFFCIVGNPDWAAIESASAQGHEIGSHTLTHPDLTTLTDAEVITEESGAKDLIETHTGKPCVSIAYPYCTVPNKSITSQYYSFARSCNGSLVPSTPSDFLSIGSLGADGDMNVASDNAASSGEWLVWLIHGIDDDAACCPITSSKLQSNLDYVAANTDNWWIETFGNVSRYIQERDAAVLTVLSSGTTSITLQLTDSLDDAIFNYPITLRRAIPSGWMSASVTQNGIAVPSQVVNGKLMFDVVPNGGDIVLSKAEVPLALVASVNPSSYGDSVTFSATVLTNGITASNATGTVIFLDGGSAIGTNAVNGGGQASLVVSNLSVGAHSITAAYSGDANYSSNTSGTLAHEVSPRAVVLSGIKVYDGTNAISAADLTISNLVSGDNVTLSGAGTLASKDAGSQAIAVVPDTTLTPALVDWSWAGQNYWGLYAWFNTPPNFGNAMICVVSTRNNVGSGFVNSVSFPDAPDFTRIAQAVNANGVTTEIWYNPSVYSTNNQLTVSFSNPNISAVCIVAQYTNLALDGALDQTASATGTGTAAVTGTTPTTTQPAELWIGGIGHANTDSLSGILNGFTEVSGQSSSHPATTAADQVTLHFLQKVVTATGEAGSGGTIGASREWAGAIATFKAAGERGLLLGGPDADNYTLTGATGVALVTAKPLNYTGITADSRAYDGTANATFTGTAAALAPEDVGTGTASDGKPYAGDTVNFVTGTLTGSFADKNVGTAKPVTLSGGLSLSGAQAGNYSVGSSSTALTANITGAASSLELGSSQNPSDEGDSLTFTATVSSVDTPTEEVVFSANGAAFSTNSLVGGVASAAYSQLPVGTNSITAQFAAQGNYLASSNSLQQVVRMVVASVMLSYSFDGSHLNLSWPDGGVLLEAPTLFDPWTTNTIGTNFVSIIMTNDTIFFKAIMPST